MCSDSGDLFVWISAVGYSASMYECLLKIKIAFFSCICIGTDSVETELRCQIWPESIKVALFPKYLHSFLTSLLNISRFPSVASSSLGLPFRSVSLAQR